MKFASRYLSTIFLTMLTGGLLHSCLHTVQVPRMCAVTVTVDAGRTASLRVEPLTVGKKVEFLAARWLRPLEAYAYIPSLIEHVRVTVTAGDMETVTATENVAGLDQASITVEVPVGLGRNFLVEALSAVNMVVWFGQKSDVDLTGASLTIPITMVPGAVIVPQVTGTDPADGAIDIPLKATVAASFGDESGLPVNMDARTIADTSFTVEDMQSGQQVRGTVMASGATATFTPATDLLPNRDYRATISTAVRSAYGIPLAQDAVWLFTTAPTVPAVTATSPGSGETGVALNVLLTAVFSEAMDPATIDGTTVLLSGTAGTVTYDGASRIATYVPSAPLASATTYTATITTGARSALNVPLARDHVWSFTTGTATDIVAPVFGGLDSVTNLSPTSMRLSWTAAIDNVTQSGSIVFLIYQATASGGQDFASPTYQTAPGATFYEVTGLTPGFTYFFVVRARDEAGNIDLNLVERFTVYPGLFVDVAIGSDVTGDGTAGNPYRTITKALSVSPGDRAIYVSAGTYDLAAGEMFPLQLQPATALLCRGAGLTTIIDATGSSADAIHGHEGALIDNCTLISEAGRAAIDDRIGGVGAPTQTFVSNALINATGADAIVFSAASSLVSSTITGTMGTGVAILAGRPTIVGNTIRGGQIGIRVASASDSSIESNTLENNGIGIEVTAAGGRPSVRNNAISNNAIGILVTAGAPLVHKNELRTNTISGNNVGIEIAGGMPTVSFNTVANNDTGINVSGGTPVIKSNSIFCNATADLNIEVNNPIDAKINAWDHEPPDVRQAPCEPGTDICYADTVGMPSFTPYSSAAPGACP